MTLLLVYRLLRRMNLLAVRDLETCSFVIFEYIYIRVTEYRTRAKAAEFMKRESVSYPETLFSLFFHRQIYADRHDY